MSNILLYLCGLAELNNHIRAVILEGSRAFGHVDEFSDYDICYLTRSNQPFQNGQMIPILVEQFGEIAIMQIPDNGDPSEITTYLIQFKSGLRIDMTFRLMKMVTELESASTILLDKDNHFHDMVVASDRDYWIKRPTQQEFGQHVNEFWWCCPYVAKAVKRDQHLHALEQLGTLIRYEYRIMLGYLIGTRYNFHEVNLGKNGTNIKDLLPKSKMSYYETLLASYVGAKEVQSALESLMNSYERLSHEVAKKLGYQVNDNESKNTMLFIRAQW